MPVSPITFFFDFSSPYAYLASTQIEAIAARHLRDIEWVPVLLGPVFQATGSRPLIDQPLKGDYARVDIRRLAERLAARPGAWQAIYPVDSIAPLMRRMCSAIGDG